MSIKSKVFAVAATVTMIGGVGAAGAVSANAATPSCGPTCVNWYSSVFGNARHPNFVLDTLRQGAKVGQPQILFRASNSDPAEDYTVSEQGTVAEFFLAGLVGAAVNLHYGGGAAGFPDLIAYEIQYSPYGVDSGLCVGVGSTAVAGTKVALEPCGVSSKTVWIEDTADGAPGGLPLINGSDTNFSQPFVLTYPSNAYPTDMPRAQLYVTNLTGFSGGTNDDNQIFAEVSGVLR